MTFASIIIPFNKGERYLIDCLDSLAEQNLDDCEIILILNGVKENIEDLLNQYESKMNLIIKNIPDEITVGKARNIGIEMACGDYIYFMDSDDYLYEDALDKLISNARRNNDDIIIGEKINTFFIRERFEEELEKPHINMTVGGESSLLFLIRLIAGTQTSGYDLISALHCLIKKDILEDLRFDETRRYFTDYYFMIELLDKINSFTCVSNAVYAKRERDDMVYLTSLSQEIFDNNFTLFFKEYFKVKEVLNNKSGEKFELLKSQIINELHKYYYQHYSRFYVRSPEDRWRVDYIDDMAEIAREFPRETISAKDRFEINALCKKNMKLYDRLVKIRWGYVKLKQIKEEHWRFNTAVYDNYFIKKPIKNNKIIFESFYGRYYSDSPKYIYEYLLENHGDEYEMVWVIDDNSIEIPGNPIKVKRFSMEFYKHLGQSKYFVFNTRQAARLNKKEGQIFISTWHGTPLKRLGFDIENIYVNNPNTKEAYRTDSRLWDYLISPNNYTTNILRRAFAYDGKIIESGYPRNDILYNASDNDVDSIKKALNLPKHKKIILYAPTWRDDEQIDTALANFTLELDLKKLQENFSDEYIILLRMHYFIANQLDITEFEGFAYDVSSYEDIGEIYLISDILITDYSSVFFDYANLKRPMLFFTYDLEKYENLLRGFYIDIHEDIPGPLLKTNDELINALGNIDDINENYREKYNIFYDRFCKIEDGNASKRIYDEIWKD